MINILCIDVNKLNVKHTIFILVYQIHEMTNFYDQICNLFIRPSRQTYTSYDLGTKNIIKALQSYIKTVRDRIFHF